LTEPVRALELTTALEALPEQFTMGLGGGACAPAVACATTDHIRALLEDVEREQRPLWLGWSIDREVAVAHAALLDEQLEDAVVVLAPVLLLLSPSIDGAGASAAARAPVRRERRDRSRADDEGRSAKRRDRERDSREHERTPEPEADRSDAYPPVQLPRRTPSAKGRAGDRKRGSLPRSSRGAPLDKGTRVRVLDGPFSGKVGVVQELDGKGGARVMLGLLAVRVDVRDLSRCESGRDRPVLSTSHRKPVPVRS
jgi:hypothetical protein